MKRVVYCIIILFLLINDGYSDLTLSEGDTFTYEFSSLPYLRTFSSPNQPFGRFVVNFRAGTFGPDEAVRMLFFENGLNDTPDPNAIWTGTGVEPYRVDAINRWQDLQGAFRITQILGTSTIESIDVYAGRLNGQTFDLFYERITPVPEPAVTLLLTTALIICFARVLKR